MTTRNYHLATNGGGRFRGTRSCRGAHASCGGRRVRTAASGPGPTRAQSDGGGGTQVAPPPPQQHRRQSAILSRLPRRLQTPHAVRALGRALTVISDVLEQVLGAVARREYAQP